VVTAPPNVEIDETSDVRAVTDYLEGLRPGTTVWYGQSTKAWWAMVPLRRSARLVEAVNPGELRQAIANAGVWPWPRR
jgi:hypothetical protein